MPEISHVRRARFAAVCTLLVSLPLACSPAHDRPGMMHGNSVPSGGGGSSTAGCSEGQIRKCSATLAQHGDVLSCFDGTQTCRGSEWSDCETGTVSITSLPLGHRRSLLNLSDPAPCNRSNPCDPTCRVYREDPSGPIVAQVNASTGWWTGDPSSVPLDVRNALAKPECKTALDCQQNQHCVNVATASACAHDKCASGGGLDSACDPCVQLVCDRNPTCCQTSSAPPCAIDQGELREPSSGRCYFPVPVSHTWQGAQTACRNHRAGWDLACVNDATQQDFLAQNTAIESWLGVYRTASGFACSNGEALPSDLPWNYGEPNNFGGNENCVHMYPGALGASWNDVACNAVTMPAWCSGPAGGALNWNVDCINAVATACGASCKASGTDQAAVCQAWNPGQSNASAMGVDLSIDTPCNGRVPVCNHGMVASTGAVVHVLSADLEQLNQASPALDAELGQCSTSAAIEPGACVMVDGCVELLAQSNAALWVQAPSGEVRTDDNWGFNVAGTGCVLPHCSTNGGASPCVASSTRTEDYHGSCDSIQAIPQWSYLQFHAVTPGDSAIRFQVAAAASEAELETATAVDLVTASAANGINECLLSGPAPNCPVDLYQALLANGLANSSYLRLIMILMPSSDGTQSPVLDYWRINYACPDAT